MTASHVHGTPGDSTDVDEGWSGEFAIQWSSLTIYRGEHVYESAVRIESNRFFADVERTDIPPSNGEIWAINFSRVENLVPGIHDWSWSVQGLHLMHIPERWGRVHFIDRPTGTVCGYSFNELNIDPPGPLCDGSSPVTVSAALKGQSYGSTGFPKVSVDLTPLGGAGFVPMVPAGNNTWRLTTLIPQRTRAGQHSLSVMAEDANGGCAFTSKVFRIIPPDDLPILTEGLHPSWTVTGNSMRVEFNGEPFPGLLFHPDGSAPDSLVCGIAASDIRGFGQYGFETLSLKVGASRQSIESLELHVDFVTTHTAQHHIERLPLNTCPMIREGEYQVTVPLMNIIGSSEACLKSITLKSPSGAVTDTILLGDVHLIPRKYD